MSNEYRIKGSSLKTKFEFVRETFGDRAAAELEGHFDRSLFPILDSSWYPFSFNSEVNRILVNTYLDGDVSRMREVGIFSAERVLTTVYKFFTSGRTFIEFMRRAETLHETCYSEGGMKVTVGSDGKSCEIHLRAPYFSQVDMHVAAGFYIGAARLLGESDVTCDTTPEAGGARFVIRWS
jgi:hypothetical protein